MPFDGTNIDTAGRVLLKAADDIERNGWFGGCEHPRQIGREGYMTSCAMIALANAADGFEGKAYRRAAKRLAAHLGFRNPAQIVGWNDSQDGPEPVIEALRAAALG